MTQKPTTRTLTKSTDSDMQIESGLQLWARLSNRPSLQGLDTVLFSDGPRYMETIEICGNVSSGKTLLLTQLFATCCLPLKFRDVPLNGLCVNAILINTDHHFQVSKLAALMSKRINDAFVANNKQPPNASAVDGIIDQSLNRLTIVDCFDCMQFLLTLESLESILLNDDKMALVAIDSMSSYYWQARENGGIRTMDLYLRNLIRLVQKSTFPLKVVTIYTKPNYFVTNSRDRNDCSEKPSLERINYKIRLLRDERKNKFSALIESATGKKEMKYKIDESGIKWTINEEGREQSCE